MSNRSSSSIRQLLNVSAYFTGFSASPRQDNQLEQPNTPVAKKSKDLRYKTSTFNNRNEVSRSKGPNKINQTHIAIPAASFGNHQQNNSLQGVHDVGGLSRSPANAIALGMIGSDNSSNSCCQCSKISNFTHINLQTGDIGCAICLDSDQQHQRDQYTLVDNLQANIAKKTAYLYTLIPDKGDPRRQQWKQIHDLAANIYRFQSRIHELCDFEQIYRGLIGATPQTLPVLVDSFICKANNPFYMFPILDQSRVFINLILLTCGKTKWVLQLDANTHAPKLHHHLNTDIQSKIQWISGGFRAFMHQDTTLDTARSTQEPQLFYMKKGSKNKYLAPNGPQYSVSEADQAWVQPKEELTIKFDDCNIIIRQSLVDSDPFPDNISSSVYAQNADILINIKIFVQK